MSPEVVAILPEVLAVLQEVNGEEKGVAINGLGRIKGLPIVCNGMSPAIG